METENRIISAEGLKTRCYEICDEYNTEHLYIDRIIDEIDNAPDVDTVEIPCKIGDFVWAIRNFKGKKHPQRGIVSDMYFLKDMSLQIVVKYVARGEWGKTVFATDKEAYAAIGERKNNE